MKTIKVGDVYFLKSPFQSTTSSDTVKKLSYLLGTPSHRPAVVIREPSPWDKFNEVTVITATSDTEPNIRFHLHDRFGYISDDYYFCPHLPYSVPITRLGRHVGTLDKDELEELLYAFRWIHDPTLQSNPNAKIPACYQKFTKPSYIYPRVSESTIPHGRDMYVITLDDEGIISTPHESLKGTLEGKKLEIKGVKDVAPVMVDGNIENRFPPSIFPVSQLQEVAARFDIDERFFSNRYPIAKKDPSILTEEEEKEIRQTISDFQYQGVLEIYKTMQPVDALLFGPRLPTHVLSRLCGVRMSEAAALKRLCNILHDMPKEEYCARVNNPPDLKDSTSKESKETKQEPLDEMSRLFPHYEDGSSEMRRAINDIRPYMSHNRIHKIPTALQETFIRIPQYKIRSIYTGKSFLQNYNNAYNTYKRLLLGRIKDVGEMKVEKVITI